MVCGAWRAQDAPSERFADGDAGTKRMYATPDARGRGHARRVLAAPEDSARVAGRGRTVLETGLKQPEALGRYRSCGYTEVAEFGGAPDELLGGCLGKPR